MVDEVDGLTEAFMGADMASWDKMMAGSRESQVVQSGLDGAVYAACFNTPAGRAVLGDMYARFVNVTIVEPGQAPETHGIRQGQANVVFDIIDHINKTERGSEDE
jgi:hypothetical protein